MKVSDYIVHFLEKKKVEHIFGYPGGMVTHLMDSINRNNTVQGHVTYHEQAAAFCACGYAQMSHNVGVAYSTSGPGATNLITGICNAYFDSIPTIFITGQVNTFEANQGLNIRQRGFQETDIVSMVKKCTKYCCYIHEEGEIRYYLEKAWHMATTGRPGPVLLDIPMDILRAEIDEDSLCAYEADMIQNTADVDISRIKDKLLHANRPCILIGAGIKNCVNREEIVEALKKWNVPVVSSMIACDVMGNADNYYGFIGAYGNRCANFIVAKCDLLLTLGSRLDIRQVGAKRNRFASAAEIIRIDIDENELNYKVRENDYNILGDVNSYILKLSKENIVFDQIENWKKVCRILNEKLEEIDNNIPNKMLQTFMKRNMDSNLVVTTDVGQNQVWVAQENKYFNGARVLFSGGHGAMGYSLPAAIGAYYGSGKPVVSFNGDGGLQMNMQELQFIIRDQLPILVVVLNNYSLGMIRQFQKLYFNGCYYQTVQEKGYSVPQFSKIAYAYGLAYFNAEDIETLSTFIWDRMTPTLLEINLYQETVVTPKLSYGNENQDQEPKIERALYEYLMQL